MSFFSRIKQLASETAIYGISSIVGRMVNFLLFPFYSNVFSPDLYGVISVVYAAFIFLNVVYQYGMESAYLKFASVSADVAERRVTFSTALWSLLATGAVLSLVMIVFRRPVGLLIGLDRSWLSLLYYAALILLLDTLAIVPFAELRLQNRPWRFAVIRFINVLVNVGMNLFLILGLGMGIEAVFIANAAASASSLLLLLPTFRRELLPTFDGRLWKELLLFGLPFVPGGIGYAITERVNIFYLSNLSRERVLALYGAHIDTAALAAKAEQAAQAAAASASGLSQAALNAHMAAAADAVYGSYVVGVFNGVLKLAIFMTLVVQMFRFAWQPFFLQHARDADARPLFARIFTLFSAVGLLIFLTISFFAREIVALPLPGGYNLIARSYWLGLFIVPVSLLGYLFQGWYYNFSAGAYIEKQTKYFVHCTLVGAATALLLNMLLVPRYGMAAAAWATTASYAAMALMLHVVVRRFYAVPYDWTRILGMGALAGALFLAWYLVAPLHRWWAELLLLAAFLGGLVGLRVVPPAHLRAFISRLKRRPAPR